QPMGPQPARLLVRPRGIVRAFGASSLCCGSSAGCAKRPEQERQPPGRVDAAQHDAFFSWAGVKAPEVSAKARTIYSLDGEVRAGSPARFVPSRPAVPHVRHAEIWSVVRLERSDWEEPVWRRVSADLDRWQAAGNRSAGSQLDFDARTRGSDRYAVFSAEARRRSPRRYRLSITGSMDWSAGGDPAASTASGSVVDDVVLQTYQGRRTVPGYEAYLRSSARSPFPYRSGSVEGGAWRAP
ncbi:hypothetical protein OY671_008930, partial [Metschnikowia pulcherrima]